MITVTCTADSATYWTDSSTYWEYYTNIKFVEPTWDYDIEIEKPRIDLKYALKPKKDSNMKTLYEVVVVSDEGIILFDGKTVAEDDREAEFNVDVSGVIKEANLKPKNITVICLDLGDVKMRKETQKVVVVKEDDDK